MLNIQPLFAAPHTVNDKGIHGWQWYGKTDASCQEKDDGETERHMVLACWPPDSYSLGIVPRAVFCYRAGADGWTSEGRGK